MFLNERTRLVIGASVIALITVLFVFKKVDYDEKALVFEQNEKILSAKIEMLEEQIAERDFEIRELQTEVDEANAYRDSLTSVVDEYEPTIINTIEYITNGDSIEAEEAKKDLLTYVNAVKLERIEFKQAIADRDEIIELQQAQIDDLNRQIGLLVESKDQLDLTNKQLKKQIRKEVRKRRLTTVGSIAAIVGVIFITSR